MKKISSYLFIAITMVVAASCTKGLKKTKSGLLYKIISDGKGSPVKKGDFIKFNYVQKVHDSVLRTTIGVFPGYTVIDSVGPNYDPAEIFPLLRKGDSAVVVMLVDTLVKRFGGQLPPFIKKGDKIIIAFKVIDVFTSKELADEDRNKELQKQKDIENKIVADYVAANKINAQKTEKGTYVEIKSVGDGPAVDSGKQVCLFYTGKSLPSGKVFESNITGPRKDTLKFVVGRKGMIQGMDDGIRLFKKGGQGTLYIPAYLAYDANPGPNNKPYENLMFDIVVADVTNAPKEQPRSAMPQLTPEQLKMLQEKMQKRGNK